MKIQASRCIFSLLAALLLSLQPCWADDSDGGNKEDGQVYQDATAVEGNSSQAAGYANTGDDEAAAATAGAGFDSATNTTNPPVYLNCDPCVVDPNDLKQYDPPQPSLKPSYVPPLPDSN